ncbi:NAD(P)/FAD-dependent oxidoreductase [Neisseria sp. Ec49-e6-T10]|uniref:NAD(P)/FAD-dependent oxidoreductase n=1 Tax=Neisseria sp. Ec49-e6-T10 TaxID=3140744 RepID=UPI003EBC12DD
MKEAKIPFNQNYNGWLSYPERFPVFPSFTGNTTADWVVIGAGYAGFAFARRLAENNPSAKVILLEANTIENNASSRNSGFIIGLAHQINSSASELKKAEVYNRILSSGVTQLREFVSMNNIDCEWSEVGKYYCIVNQKFDQALNQHIHELQSLNEGFSVLQQDEIFNRFGTKFYQKGIHTNDGILINPAKLMIGLAEHLPENVLFYEQSPVLSLDIGKYVKIKLPYGEISAANVMIATNAVAGQLFAQANNQAPMATFSSLTEPLTKEQLSRLPKMTPWGILPINAIAAATLRFTPDNRFLIRQHVSFAPNGQISSNQTYQATQKHRKIFASIYPNLNDVSIEKTWSGIISVTRNGAPIWGRLSSNVYIASGCNGSGISKQTVAGMVLADLACNVDNPLILDMQFLGKANYLPPSPILDIAVNSALFKENIIACSEIGL